MAIKIPGNVGHMVILVSVLLCNFFSLKNMRNVMPFFSDAILMWTHHDASHMALRTADFIWLKNTRIAMLFLYSDVI